MKQSYLPFTTNTLLICLFLLKMSLFLFDDAKVRRFSDVTMDFGLFCRKIVFLLT